MKSFLHRNLIIAIVTYLALLIVTTFVFSFVYFGISKVYHLNSPIENAQNNFLDWLYFAVMNFFGTVDFDKSPEQIRLIVILQHFLNSIIIPVASGVIFYYILNRPPKIIFPDNLIVRKRTSEGSKGKITLSTIIGNRGKEKIYGVTCQLIFVYYIKSRNGSIATNGETVFSQYTPYIDNFFRFSFELDTFPSEMIRILINREGINKEAHVIIMISGKLGGLGENFMLEKVYKMPNVIIAKENEKIRTYKDDGNGQLIRSELDWNKINKIVHYSESEREQIVAEIKGMLKSRM